MESFKQYLNEKKQTNEYSSDFLSEANPFISTVAGKLNDYVRGIGSEKEKKYTKVSVDFTKGPIIEDIINKSQDTVKNSSNNDITTELKKEVKYRTEEIVKNIFEILKGAQKASNKTPKEYNLLKYFQFMMVTNKGVEVYFSPCTKKDRNPKVAAEDFKRILTHSTTKNIKSLPENAIIISEDNVSKGYSKFMGMKQTKLKLDNFMEIQEAGIEELSDYVGKNLSNIEKNIKKAKAEEKKQKYQDAHIEANGEEVPVYFIRWQIKPENLNNLIFNKDNAPSFNPDKMSEKDIAIYFEEAINKQLIDLDLVENYGSLYTLTNKEHGYCGMSFTESSFRLYFRDRSFANAISSDLHQFDKTIGSATSTTRPEKTLNSLKPTVTRENFLGSTLLKSVVMPEVNKGKKIAAINIEFEDNLKEEFKAFLNNDDSVNTDELKKYIKTIFNKSVNVAHNHLIGIGATNNEMCVYIDSTSNLIVDRMIEQIKNITNAKISKTFTLFESEELKYLSETLTKDVMNIDDDDSFKKLLEKLSNIVKLNICETSPARAIQINADSNLAIKVIERNNWDDLPQHTDEIKNKLIEYINNIVFENISNNENIKNAFIGPYINRSSFYIVFNDDAEGELKILDDKLVNAGLTTNVNENGILIHKKVIKNINTYKEKGQKYFDENSEVFTKTLVDSAETIISNSKKHKVLTVELTDEFFKSVSKENEKDGYKILTNIIKKSVKFADNVCEGFYALGKSINFICTDKESDIFEKELKSIFNNAKITEKNLTLAVSIYEKAKVAYSDIDKAISNNDKDVVEIVKNIISQQGLNQAVQEKTERTKPVIYVPIKSDKLKEMIKGTENNTLDILKKCLTNTLAEIYKNSNEIEHDENYIGFFACAYNNERCIAFVFDEIKSLEHYVKVIAPKFGLSEKELHVELEHEIPEVSIKYMKNTKTDMSNLSEEHWKELLNILKDAFEIQKKETEEKESATYSIEVELTSDIIGKDITGDDTSFSKNNIINKVIELCNNVNNVVKNKIDSYLGIIPEGRKLKFIFKDETDSTALIMIIRSQLADYLQKTSGSGINAGEIKDLKAIKGPSLNKSVRDILEKSKNEGLTSEDLTSLIAQASKSSTNQAKTNTENFEWSFVLNFENIGDKNFSDLTRYDDGNLYILPLSESFNKKSFANGLFKHLLNHLNEATLKNKISEDDKLLYFNNNYETKNFMNNIEGDKNASNVKINSIADGIYIPVFLKYYVKQINNELSTFSLTGKVTYTDKKIYVEFTGNFKDASKFLIHICKLVGSNAPSRGFKIEDIKKPDNEELENTIKKILGIN